MIPVVLGSIVRVALGGQQRHFSTAWNVFGTALKRWWIASSGHSRKLSFRCIGFSETQKARRSKARRHKKMAAAAQRPGPVGCSLLLTYFKLESFAWLRRVGH